MANIQVNRLTNLNIYMNGQSMIGRAEEVNLPEIKHKLAEHKALGMIGTVELWSGIDKMEASIKWNSFYADAYSVAANPFRTVSIQGRGSMEVYNAAGRVAQQPVVIYLTGQFKNVPGGNFKQHDNVEITSQMTVTYMKVEINRQEIVEIDVLSNIYKVNGEDMLAEYRANLGA